MTFYVVPSFCAIILKALLFWWGRSQLKGNGALILLLSALLVMNLVEFSSFLLLDSPREIAWLMHAYYCAATFAVAAGLNLFLCLTGGDANHLPKINWALAVIFGAMSLMPGVVIAGIENIGYTFMRVPGTLYTAWSAYIVSTLIFSIFVLFTGYKKSKDMLQRRRCLAVLVGLLPLICSAICVIFLMLLGIKINATVVLSLAVIFFLGALIYSEKRHGLFRILASVPFTEEYTLRSELTGLVRKIESNAFGRADSLDFKDHIKRIEALYVDLAIIANDGNKTHAAAALGISNATLHRKATRKRRRHTASDQSAAKVEAFRFTPPRT